MIVPTSWDYWKDKAHFLSVSRTHWDYHLTIVPAPRPRSFIALSSFRKWDTVFIKKRQGHCCHETYILVNYSGNSLANNQVTKTSPDKQTLAVLLLPEFVRLSLSLILRYPLMRMPSNLLVSVCPVQSACWVLTLSPISSPDTDRCILCGAAGINSWWSLGNLQLLSLVWGLGTVWMLRCDCGLQLCCLLLWLLRSPEVEISSIPKCDWVAGTWGWGRLSHGGVAHAVCEGYCHVCDQHTQGHELQGPWALILTLDSLLPCRLMDTDKMPK